ncbi:MAG: hypothetical protein RL642_832 [Bacteroidota bacterium]
MKKHLIYLLILSFTLKLNAVAAILPPTKHQSSLDKSQVERIKAIASMSLAEYEQLLGHKASTIEKYAFDRMKMKSRKMFDSEGNLQKKFEKRFVKADAKSEGKSEGSFWGGFALGYLLGVVGFLIAVFANRDGDKKRRVKGAIWGLVIQTLVITIWFLIWIYNISKS